MLTVLSEHIVTVILIFLDTGWVFVKSKFSVTGCYGMNYFRIKPVIWPGKLKCSFWVISDFFRSVSNSEYLLDQFGHADIVAFWLIPFNCKRLDAHPRLMDTVTEA